MCLLCCASAGSSALAEMPDGSSSTDKLYSCTQCLKHFSSLGSLTQHMNIHTNKCKCTECGRCFNCEQHLTDLRRIHSGDKTILMQYF